METLYMENLSKLDRIFRATVGLTLVMGSSLVLVLSPAAIASLCLLAVYPLMTAMIGWDPIVAATKSIYTKLSGTTLRTLPSSQVARA